MKIHPNPAQGGREGSRTSAWPTWRRRALALGTAILLGLYSVAPAWAAPAGAAGASAKAAASPAPASGSPTGGCQLNSPRGQIKHVVTIIFDNTHFMRDPARDGSTLVPSDLEQMPHLLNFIKNNGVLLSNHHTQLISHTSDDLITILTGVYPDRHGIATAANSYLQFQSNGSARLQTGFTYWTDLTPDGTYNLLSGAVDANHLNGVNAPAPWVPFTRAGCDVGAVAAADMEIENTGADLTTIFGAGSPPTMDHNAFADFEGVAIHCAASSTLCSNANGGFPDRLPWEPNTDGTAATTDGMTGTSTAYEGYNALFGHVNVTKAFRNLGLLAPNGNLLDINGNTIVDDFPAGTTTPGFPGFSIAPQYLLGYLADILEAGVPVVYGYIETPHRPLPVNPYGYGFAGADGKGDVNDYGPGEAHYVQQLQQYDDSFNKFFTRLAKDGITPANTLFIIGAEEGDHVVAANPTNPGCDGVNTPCTYGNTQGNEVGELSLNFIGLMQGEKSITTPASVNLDDAPDIYLTGNPAPTDSTLRAYERAAGTLTVNNLITGASDTLALDMANATEFKMLHMLTFDPPRTPSFTMFANDDYFVTDANPRNTPTPLCGTSADPATACVTQVPGFAWNHGDVQTQITNTWFSFVGPGVAAAGVDKTTFSDHTDIRPTMLTLLGLTDDYPHEGRALVEELKGWAQSSAIKKSANFVALAQTLKQINAAVGPLGLASLHASTVAMESGSAGDDSTFTSIEGQLDSFTSQRDALAAQILAQLEAAEFSGTPIPDATAASLIQQAQALLSQVKAYANGL